MKEQTKQELIELLETSLTTTDLNIRDLEESLGELLTSTNSCKNSPYIKALREIYSYVYNSVTYGDWSKETIIEFIKDALTVLNTPLRQLEEEEAAITRQLELDEYHKSLSLKLLQLMSDTEMTSVPSYVNKDEKGLYVCFRIPYFKDDSIRGYDEYLVYLNGYPSEYDYVVKLIKDYYEKVNKIREKAELITAAKSKLTDEEKELLEL
jgi:hypothetical protein